MSNLDRFKVNLNDFSLIPVIDSGRLQEARKVKHNATNKVYIAEVTNSFIEDSNEIINY